MGQVIRARWWRVPAAEVPRDRETLGPWLYDWWERIDAWIAEHRANGTDIDAKRPISNPADPTKPQQIDPAGTGA
jgi:hypothetical protein